jgi:transposase
VFALREVEVWQHALEGEELRAGALHALARRDVREHAHVVPADKGYAGAELEATAQERFGATIIRPRRKDEPGRGPHIAPIRQCIESMFWTLKDRLGLERHHARTLHGIRARIAPKLLALAAGVWLNHTLGRPTRAFANLAT